MNLLDRYTKVLFFLMILTGLYSCKNHIASLSDSENYHDATKDNTIGYITNDQLPTQETQKNLENVEVLDGTYTAEVNYSSSHSMSDNIVTQVVVNDGYVVEIKWINGAWLSSNYFKPSRIDVTNGECEASNIADNFRSKIKVLNLKYQKTSM